MKAYGIVTKLLLLFVCIGNYYTANNLLTRLRADPAYLTNLYPEGTKIVQLGINIEQAINMQATISFLAMLIALTQPKGNGVTKLIVLSSILCGISINSAIMVKQSKTTEAHPSDKYLHPGLGVGNLIVLVLYSYHIRFFKFAGDIVKNFGKE